MRTQNIISSLSSFLIALSIIFALPSIVRASGADPKAEKASPVAKTPAPNPAPQPRQGEAKKVYTNDDFGWYHPSVPASQSGESGAAASSETGTASGDKIVLPDPHQDPQWYAEQVTSLENDLSVIESKEESLQQFRATSSGLPTGLDLSAPIEGITTDDFIAQLESRRQEILQQLDDLADLARVNGLPPGTVNEPSVSAPPPPSLAEQQLALTTEYRDVADQLAETQDTLDAMQQQAAAQNITLIPPTPGEGGNLTTNLVSNLNSQESVLQNALSDAEDNARTLGVPPGDLR
jgi:hypothetical protein